MRKLFLAVFLPVAIFLGGIVGLIYNAETKSNLSITETKESEYINLPVTKTIDTFLHIIPDLMFLAEQQRELQKKLSLGDYSEQDLAQDYLMFAIRKGIYDQIRFIDENGIEIVRVNYNKGDPLAVPAEKLQNKGDRYYFKEAMQLEEGEIYVSPFDLNIENKKIEIPLKPMIRIATPVFDSSGERRGIVIVNFLGEILLESLRYIAANSEGDPMLLNPDGYWLLGPDPEDEWGFMYEERKERNFRNNFPKEWKAISGKDSGQFTTANGLYTFVTVYPLEEIRKSTIIKALIKAGKGLDTRNYYWTILSHIPPERLYIGSLDLRKKLLELYVVLVLIIGIGAWLIARTILSRKEAKIKLLPSPKTIKLKFILYMGTVVTIFVAVIFYWMYHQSRKGVIAQIDQQATALLQQVIITRSWIADHGGLFVEKRPGVKESPFLPGTNIVDQKGKTYFFRNPALVTRELSEYAYAAGLYRFHLTSLKLKNPANAPLPFERKALAYFEEKDYSEIKSGLASEGVEDGTRVYRRIVPLLVEKPCLECHADQGYKVGDIRGGLSVFIPMTKTLETIEQNRNSLILSWFGIICLISGVIYFLLRRMVLKPVGHLHQVANRLINGEYSVKAQLSTGDEFEELAKAFNNMTDRLKKGYEGTIKSLVAAIEARDSYTQGHTARVAQYSAAIAKEMGLADDKLDEISLGATLHDIGKIGIADEILRKSIPLTDKERHEMETHVQKGAAIIHDADFLLQALPAILYHHERPDSEGYPGGLKGDALPVVARIIAVADTFDAMTTDRPYRKAMTDKEALRELERFSGKQFDPDVVKAFRAVHDKKFS